MQAAKKEICKQHSEIEMGEQQSEIEKRTSTRDLNIWLWGHAISIYGYVGVSLNIWLCGQQADLSVTRLVILVKKIHFIGS